MGDTAGRRVAAPRIRRRLRLIASGLVLLPTLALALLVRGVTEADQQAKERSAEERALELARRSEELAGWLGTEAGLFPAPAREHFSLLQATSPLQLSQAVVLDGSCMEWRSAEDAESRPCESMRRHFDRAELFANEAEPYDPHDFSFSILAGSGVRAGYLYLFASVSDDQLTPRGGRLDRSDQLRVIVALPTDEGVSVVARFAVIPEPGDSGALTTHQVDSRWQQELRAAERLPWGDADLPPFRRPFGAWRPTALGYDIEVRLPLLTLGSRWREAELGLAVVDVDESAAGAGGQTVWVVPQSEGHFAVQAPEAARFARALRGLEANLRDRRFAIFDTRGRELFSSFEAGGTAEPELRDAVAALLLELKQGSDRSASHSQLQLSAARVDGDRGQRLGFLLEQDPAPPWRPRLDAIVRESPLSATILAGSLLLLFVVLAYAGRLSQRIVALTNDVGADLEAKDEIGELSRRLSDLIARDRAHRDYLDQLPRILGHETLGPLSVVKMAIDDLADSDPARRAIRSIEELINDLREATSLEDALEQGERVELDLVDLVREAASAYRDSNGASLEIKVSGREFRTVVIERRIEQLLDKLLDNAVDFSGEHPIRVHVDCDRDEARIRVENSGSQLPTGPAADQLFAPMRSGRKRTAERHLGLGLYIARVIAEQHGGRIRAWNEGRDRVVFEVTIRRAI